MGKTERQAYLEAIRSRYWIATRNEKATILDEFCSVCGYNRKYTIRLLNRKVKPATKKKVGRRSTYSSPKLLTALTRKFHTPA